MDRDHIAATKRAYGGSARRFAEAVGTAVSADFEAPVDRSVLDTFVDLIPRSGPMVMDAGCGTGRIARYLADSGLDAVGIDIAHGMVAEARRAHRDIPFGVADLIHLPCGSASLDAIAYWYSIITTPPENLDRVWSELRRVLARGGPALIAFQCGSGGRIERQNAYGTSTNLTLFRHEPSRVHTGLEAAGLSVHTFVRRGPVFDHESSDQAFFIATSGH